jgi:hypothetical protein
MTAVQGRQLTLPNGQIIACLRDRRSIMGGKDPDQQCRKIGVVILVER